MAFITDSEAARAAFTTATQQAQNTVRDLFSSYGFTRQTPTGAWTTQQGAAAFDPNNFVTFNPATGSVSMNDAAVQAAGQGEFGVGFGYNKATDVLGSAASREALATSALRSRGIVGGGLMRQTAGTAEAQQGRDVGQLAAEFLGGLGATYGGIGSAVTSAFQGGIESSGVGAQTMAATTPVSASPPATTVGTTDSNPYKTKGIPGGNAPKNPNGGSLYTGPGGVTWQYRINGPSGRGWYKR